MQIFHHFVQVSIEQLKGLTVSQVDMMSASDWTINNAIGWLDWIQLCVRESSSVTHAAYVADLMQVR